ncbi:MAG: 16S rRNA (cytidine(1402)-2'-O)-methyltransferase [Hyphomicrobiaceae bacterium]|nr:16S rRNA (cytidine(1402)-2'-O)-methyltransferase [Hyphomicrobiaceae bacterium]
MAAERDEREPEQVKFALFGSAFAAPALAPGLYLVSTPIGNLGDMTIRGLQTLAAADLVLCEDTRTSARLLDHFGIRTRRAALHEHNERERAPALVAEIATGKALALISDAGTPLLSDPGFPLVRAVRDTGLDVFAVPGASALLAGLSISGLPTDRFGFFGFLPVKGAARKAELEKLADRPETLVFYESPRRLAATLADMAASFGSDRPAVVALELTKKFERSFSGTLMELAEKMTVDDQKGEAVILVGGAAAPSIDEDAWRSALAALIRTRSLKDAVDEVTQSFGVRRRDVYNEALTLKK